jgi:hypothetical protein
VICGSHAGRYPGLLAARAGVRAIVLSDGGIGLRRAGVAGLGVLADAGIPAVAVSHTSARIGDAADILDRGVVSESNTPASRLGCNPGMTAHEAAARLAKASTPPAGELPAIAEGRHLIREEAPRIWALDSAAMVRAGDAHSILMLGSHGGLVGGDPKAALRTDALAAVFNDAGVGCDAAGVARLAPLDARSIAAATVSSETAEIGNGTSTYREGRLSTVNRTAAALGAERGMSARAFAACVSRRGEEA